MMIILILMMTTTIMIYSDDVGFGEWGNEGHTNVSYIGSNPALAPQPRATSILANRTLNTLVLGIDVWLFYTSNNIFEITGDRVSVRGENGGREVGLALFDD